MRRTWERQLVEEGREQVLTSKLGNEPVVWWMASAVMGLIGIVALAVPAQAAHTIQPQWSEDVALSAGSGTAAIQASNVLTTSVYLPLIRAFNPCVPIPGESYGSLTVNPPPTDRPAGEHADLNLALRGYAPTTAYLGLIDIGGGSDPNAPQLPGLFADNRTGAFNAVYRVYDWDWGCNCRDGLITNPEVTLAGLGVTPGETIHVPDSGYTIGSGYEVLVLYASPERITLKYTREDNVIKGYTLHVEGVCVEPNLLALYRSLNDAGRGRLPALRAGQAFGRARGGEVGVAIRDWGTFLDPRSRKDWWRGR